MDLFRYGVRFGTQGQTLDDFMFIMSDTGNVRLGEV